MTKSIICTIERAELDHEVEVIRSPAQQDETVATCSSCGHFIKFPGSISGAALDELIEEHGTVNSL